MNQVNELNAVGYTRHRSEDFLLNQHEMIKKFCHRNNINLVGTYTDHCITQNNFGISDYEGLKSFLHEYPGSIQFLIVENYDRLSRNMTECIQRIDELESMFKVKVVSCNKVQPYDFEDPNNNIVRVMSQLTAEDNANRKWN